jgi:hypothetical protein
MEYSRLKLIQDIVGVIEKCNLNMREKVANLLTIIAIFKN